MTIRIWKYELQVENEQEVDIPKAHTVLTVAIQNDAPCIWVEVDDSFETIPVKFITLGTGHVVNRNVDKYIGSYQLHGGELVFHVYTV